jgi:hypothetical protein
MSCLITMSQKELHRLELIQKIRDERLSVVQAVKLRINFETARISVGYGVSMSDFGCACRLPFCLSRLSAMTTVESASRMTRC